MHCMPIICLVSFGADAGTGMSKSAEHRRQLQFQEVLMDSEKFDGLTRKFASASSRRSIVRGLAAVALGGAVAGVATRGASACVDVKSNQDCKNDNDCCGNDVQCRNKRCECKNGFRQCRENGK